MATTREAGRVTSLRNLGAVWGGLAGVGGITHGVGEVLKGAGRRAGSCSTPGRRAGSPETSAANPR